MASNVPASSKETPLSFMQALSSAVAYYEPPQTFVNHSSPAYRDPELILVFSWMGARDAHIAKYITSHQALFPTSRILLVRCPLTHILWPPQACKDVALALPVVQSLSKDDTAVEKLSVAQGNTGGRPPKILVHIFSNGGVGNAVRLHSMLRTGPDKTLSLPRHVTVFDCCPGYFGWRKTIAALSEVLPWWTSPIIVGSIALIWLVFKLQRKPPIPDSNALALRTPDIRHSEVRRTYVYGTADVMVSWKDVEDHARRSKEAGFTTKTEKFEGATHVSCARTDNDRYWRVIQEMWHDSNT